jgi:hypothetical protein
MLHPGGMYELYWWSDNIRTNPGPDGNASNGLFDVFAPYNDFMVDIPINAGGYVDINSSPPEGLRVVGQKNNYGSDATRAHLWIQDLDHKWRTPNSGSLGGSLTISGMQPDTSFPIEWWDFNNKGTLQKRAGIISSDGFGMIVLSLDDLPPVDGSPVVDTAIKIGSYEGKPQAGISTRALGANWRRSWGRNLTANR